MTNVLTIFWASISSWNQQCCDLGRSFIALVSSYPENTKWCLSFVPVNTHEHLLSLANKREPWIEDYQFNKLHIV